MPTERRLAAIMFTDIVGYTALMGESEARGHRVRARQGEILRPLVQQYRGEWISHVGDETLASFPSESINCRCCGLSSAFASRSPDSMFRANCRLAAAVNRSARRSIAATQASLPSGSSASIFS